MSYGVDTYCLDSLRTGRLVSLAMHVGQNLYHRFTTPKGSLPGGDEEKDYGDDLTALVGTAVTAADIAAMPGRIEAAAMKDERIGSVEVTVIPTTSGPGVELTVTIDATLVDDSAGFSLVLGVSAVSVTLLGLSES
jgi:hypothetical protein